jgi:hypothetical protein
MVEDELGGLSREALLEPVCRQQAETATIARRVSTLDRGGASS